MFSFIFVYGLLQLNVFLLYFVSHGSLNLICLTVLQLGYLICAIYYFKCIHTWKEHFKWRKRLKWMILSLFFMISFAFLVSFLGTVSETNQKVLISVQRSIPLGSFLLFLVNASLVEEYFFRELIWNKLPSQSLKVILTSLFFAYSHQPSALSSWFLYGGLGLILGILRLRTDCRSSMVVHLVWNGLVFLLSIF